MNTNRGSVDFMKISAEEARRRLSSENNLARFATAKRGESADPQSSPDVQHEIIKHRGGPGTIKTPEMVRDMMAQLVTDGSSACDVARAFGVSPDVAERAASGRVGGKPANEERALKVQARRLECKDTALVKLMQSLNLIDNDKLEELGAKDLSLVASNMARVHRSLEEQNGISLNASVVVYAPERKSEDKYKVIDV